MAPLRPRVRGRFRDAERGMSPVVGVTLMVAITVLLAAVVIIMLTGAANPDVAPTMDSAVSLDATNAGTALTTDHSGGQAIDVQLNGETIATIDGSSTGSTLFLPTAPGDEVHLVASGDDSDVLVRETFDAGEAGDFVAYYPFDEDDSELRDGSLNENHGVFDGGEPEWNQDDQGTYREFDGASQSVVVDDLKTGDVTVESFTVAMTFQIDELEDTQQLVEHNSGDQEWHVEMNGDGSLQFAVDWANDHDFETGANTVDTNTVHTIVATYDGNTYRLFLDGEEVGNGTHETDVDMGRMRIGEDDSDPDDDFQNFDGRMYEFRLYYTALDDHEVEMLTKAMD